MDEESWDYDDWDLFEDDYESYAWIDFFQDLDLILENFRYLIERACRKLEERSNSQNSDLALKKQ